MAGLFDFNYEDPQQVGQNAFAAALLNAAGPSRMPISVGQALAHGLVGRQQAAAEAMQNQRRNMLADAQIRETLAQAEQRKAMALALQQRAEQEQQANLWYANPANFMRQQPPMAGAPGEGEAPTPGASTPLSQQEIAMNMARAPSPDIRRLGIAALVKPPGADANAPASVQEWEYFSKLPPEQQRAYLGMKRQGYTVKNVNGVPTIVPLMPGAEAQPLTTLTEEAAAGRVLEQQKSEGKVIGTNLAQDKRTLADMQSAFPILEKEVTNLKKHPGLPLGTGVLNWTGAIPGTPMANFVAAHNKLRGEVFLQAYQTLKGGGQITEVEGKKAEEAMVRMDRAQSADAYRQGLDDFIAAYKAGIAKMQKRVDFPGGYASPQQQSEGVRRAGGMPGDRVDLVPGSTLPSDPLGIR